MATNGELPEFRMAALDLSLTSAGLDRLADLAGDSDARRLLEETVLGELCADRDRYGEFSDGRVSTEIVDDLFYGVRGVSGLALRHF